MRKQISEAYMEKLLTNMAKARAKRGSTKRGSKIRARENKASKGNYEDAKKSGMIGDLQDKFK